MPEQKAEYKVLVQRIRDALKHSPEELQRWVELSERYFTAASDMTKDELALIEAYFKRDVQEFGARYNESESEKADSDLFKSLIANTLWEQLAEITDKTQLEWREVLQDIQHHGVYSAGEVVGLGILICEKCGNQTEHTHVDVLRPCLKCGNKQFSRKAFPA
ncbi:zinc ribbon-containing protein [Enterovibrio nigricans]|uniref:Zinc-ribbon containing domain-containing protein n=1 Tax=Enterovibrio nigricans DSM 22720 TaxID=1121868 RepID=A0A1T4U3J1_9GAMM|nr:zinc ribbon-containing protein [Enterovibrio nigricans]PKF51835.1 hypothetical protein AT251_01145 [Enterovibrio nigricans]SKA47266.1 Zinc-ribbon containing domain-containing protein [Enterovibrio nigricans DSM 22720]